MTVNSSRPIPDHKSGTRARRRKIPDWALNFYKTVAVLLLLFLAHPSATAVVSDPDLPGATNHFETILAGSYVIPMDTNLQAVVSPFNIKAYGLVNALLHTNIPVKWAITAGKVKDGIDFAANAARIYPTNQSASNLTFRAGPFIITQDLTNRAWAVITNFASSVAVYRLTTNTVVDIRYTIVHRPKVAVLDDGGTQKILTDVLDDAGFSTNNYEVLHGADVGFLPLPSCFTLVASPHFDGGTSASNQTQSIRAFVQQGGNFFAQCAAIRTYENDAYNGHFLTTQGTADDNTAVAFTYPNADMALSQFQGSLQDEGGSLQDWTLAVGSVITNNGFMNVLKSTDTNVMRSTTAKFTRGKLGSMVFYLGGHDYRPSALGDINGQRMFLNAAFVPVTRIASCLIVFQTDLEITKSDAVDVVTNGQSVTYSVVVTNRGPGGVLGATITDNFPSSLTNVTWTSAVIGGAVCTNTSGSGNINVTADIPIEAAVTFTVHANIGTEASCLVTNFATVTSPADVVDSNSSNNEAVDVDRIFPPFSCPPPTNVQCVAQVPVAATNASQFIAQGGSVTGSCCGNPTTITFLGDVSNGGSGCVSSPLIITRNYRITTGCGDFNDCSQTITVIDNTPPTITCPANITVSLYSQVPNPNPASVISSDNCGTPVNSFVSDTSVTNCDVVVITRTYKATDFCGNSNTCAQTITIIPITTASPLTNLVLCPGRDAIFSTISSAICSNIYVWRKDGGLLNGETNNSITINAVTTGDVGTYTVEVTANGTSATNSATLTVLTNAAATALTDLTNCPSTTATFTTIPSGTGPFSYIWRKGGTLIDGATTNSYSVPSLSASDAGTYTVEVIGFCTSVTNSAVLTVLTNTSASALLSLTNCPGQSATFSTTPSGAGPFSYIWTFNGAVIGGATTNSYSIASVVNGDEGSYTVEVAGFCTKVTNNATLMVLTNTTVAVLADLTNCPGTVATFNATPSGTGPFSYVWRKNGALIGGAITNSYSIVSVVDGDAGTYTVEVTGFCTSATNIGTLTILTNTTATVLTSLTNCPNTAATFTTIPSGTGPFSYVWRKDGALIGAATENSYSIPSVSDSASGTYSVEVNGFCTSATNSATLTVLTNTSATALTGLTNCPGATAAFVTTASDTGPLSYIWRKNGTLIGGATTNSYSIDSVTLDDAATYSVEVSGFCTIVTNSAILTVRTNTSTTVLTSLTNCPVTAVAFSTMPSGTGPFSFVWRINDAIIPGATTNSYSIPTITDSDAGTYTVEVNGFCTSATNSATLTVLANTTASALTSLTNCPSTVAAFSTAPAGTGPFIYVWRKDGTLIGGATTNSYSIPSVLEGDAGTYTIEVSGFCTSVTNSAILTVPTNTSATALTSLTNCPGPLAAFSTSASGTGPFSYVWRKNGTLIGGAITNTYSIANVTGNDAGTYSVEVTGFCTSATNSATLTVLTNTSATALDNLTNCLNTTATFTTTPSGNGPFIYAWRKDGALIGGATTNSYSIASAANTDAGTYTVEVTGFCTTVTNNATLTVLTNTTASALNSLTNCPCTTATFSTLASGTGPFSYFWRKNGTLVGGATTNSFSIASVATGDEGTYTVEITGFCSSATNDAILTILTNTTASALTSLTNCPNTPAIFTTVPSGTGPFTYAWRKDGVLIGGATTNSYSIASAAISDIGTYSVEVTGFCASTTNSATLSVLTNASATSLTSVTNCLSQSANFSTMASGVGPFTFVWKKNGSIIPGATTNSYSIASVATSNAGTYTVEITGFCASVTNSATLTVLIPAISVTKVCPLTPVAPGGLLVFSGTVSNSGDVTLTNVTVVNLRPTNNHPVFGPFTLAPGQSADFTGSYTVPDNVCGSYLDTVNVRGYATCTGSNVVASVTAACPITATPSLVVNRDCPAGATPLGQPLVYSGTVSNSGNVTLTNVIVVNDQPSNNTPVFGPITLAKGESVGFVGSYVVLPIDRCATTSTATLTASANSVCGSLVSGIVTKTCPVITTPRLFLTKECPTNPTPPGGLLVFSGIVSNSGNVTLTNVSVVNDYPSNNTHVIGPITLAPGQSTNFSGSYNVCANCCGPYIDTLTATGADRCTGEIVNVSATASCAGLITPHITVTKDCPTTPVTFGQLLFFSGVVSNAGNFALTNITVSDNQAGFIGEVPALAPGETFSYIAGYTATNCGPNVISTVTAIGTDVCSGNPTSGSITNGCPVLCDDLLSPSLLIINPNLQGNVFGFSFQTQSGHPYTIEFTDSLSPANWQVLSNFVGDGSASLIQIDPAQTQRFYRVQAQ